MNGKDYGFVTLIFTYLLVPIVATAALILGGILTKEYYMLVVGGACGVLGILYGLKKLPGSFLTRYLPILIPAVVFLASWAVQYFVSDGQLAGEAFPLFAAVNFPFFLAIFIYSFAGENMEVLFFGVTAFGSFLAGFTLISLLLRKRLELWRGISVTICLCVLLSGVVYLQVAQRKERVLAVDGNALTVSDEVDLRQYDPADENARLAALGGESELRITEDFPVIDGATAAYPCYAAAARAVYGVEDLRELSEYVLCNKTDMAYHNLINGKCDVFFGAQPSKEQRKMAEDKGLELRLTPVAKEAFVFFVSAENPVDDLSVEQIREIYTKKVTNWRKVGGNNKKIRPFQRPAGSGSQTIMLAKVMGDTPLPEPLKEEFAAGMGGVVSRVAEYRNSQEAIGYSFRFFTTGMKTDRQVKLLKINGVEPTVENIRNGSYPFVIHSYAVTAGSENPNVERLIDWMTSPQGQELVEKTGYVGVEEG